MNFHEWFEIGMSVVIFGLLVMSRLVLKGYAVRSRELFESQQSLFESVQGALEDCVACEKRILSLAEAAK